MNRQALLNIMVWASIVALGLWFWRMLAATAIRVF